MRRLLLALGAMLCMGAGDPGDALPDPAKEAQAREIFREVRCVVCQNESIDDSDADLAADLRRLVREQVAAGRTQDEVKAFLVARYGEFVLLTPRFSAANAALWLTPFALILSVGAWLLLSARRRRPPEAALSADEEARLGALIQDQANGHAFAPPAPQEDAEDGGRVT
jgi:cytochrome c-type biogenesis protein CcmH